MSDIVLIHPGAQREIYGDLANDETALEPPIWTRMIAGYLRDQGHNIEIIGMETGRMSAEYVGMRVKRSKARLAAIVIAGHQPSASTQQMTGVPRILEHIDCETILIGNHPSALPKRTLNECSVDYVCDGEGPLTLTGLLNGEPKESIPGLVYWDNGEIRHNKPAPLLRMEQLHGDVWDLLPMDKYRAHWWQCLDGSPRQPYASIYTTLGCPFSCPFCMINTFQHSNTYRRMPPAKVIGQIEHLHDKYGVTTFKIADEMFVLDPSHYLPICEGLAALPFANDLNIWAYARIDTIKPDTLALMRRAGIRWLALGIESGSGAVRDGATKHFDDADIRETVALIQAAGINVIGNFIFGLPEDTMETMEATLRLAESLDLDVANFYSMMAYPGSKLFAQTSPDDLPDSWLGYSQHSYDCKPLRTRTLSAADVLRFRDRAFERYYSSPRYLSRTQQKFGQAGLHTIKFMTRVTLPRKLLAS